MANKILTFRQCGDERQQKYIANVKEVPSVLIKRS